MARRKLTPQQEAIADAAKDLPNIQPRDMEFARLIASEGCTATEALKRTRDCSSWAVGTIWTEASRLANSPDIKAWIAAARAVGLASVSYSLDRYISELESMRQLCIAKGNLGAATDCLKTIGHACGLHIDRHMEVPFDPLEALNDIATKHPEYARELAREAGLKDWQPPAALAH